MLFPPRLGSCRRNRLGVAIAARGDRLVLFCLLAATWMPIVPGCATFGGRTARQEKISTSRELARKGVAAMEMGHWSQAELLLQEAVEAAPEEADARHHFAETLWHRGAADQALSQIEAAVRLEPADATLLVRAGEMALALGNHEQALSRAERAIQMDAKLAPSWALRGRVFWRLGQQDRALADLQHALELSPRNSEVLLDIAIMYRELGQSARALTTLHYLMDTYAPGEEPQMPLFLEGTALLDLGRPQQAAESLRLAVDRGPPNADVFFHLAQAELASGRYAEASAAAQQVLAIDASHPASRRLLTQLAANHPPVDSQRR